MNKPETSSSFASLFESGPRRAVVRRVQVGEVLDLEVVGIGQETVLVALDGKNEGVIDAAELRGPDGAMTVRVGSRVAARVLELDRSRGHFRLSPVSTAPIVEALVDAPSATAARGARVVTGQRVQGVVTGVERYGVFLEFEVPGESKKLRGLVPVSELGAPRGADLRKLFPVGRPLEAAVVAVDPRGRIRLSVVALKSAEERRAFEEFARGAAGEAAPGKDPKPRGFGTLGDLLRQRSR